MVLGLKFGICHSESGFCGFFFVFNRAFNASTSIFDRFPGEDEDGFFFVGFAGLSSPEGGGDGLFLSCLSAMQVPVGVRV